MTPSPDPAPNPDPPPAAPPETILTGSPRPEVSVEDELGMRLQSGLDAARARPRSPRDTLPWLGLRTLPTVDGTGLAGAADFGNYELLAEIGRGGMGVVYKARQKGLDRLVAIKMILASHLASPAQVERFYAEARAAARLRDPNIVAIHDVGELHGQHFFAMEYVAGPSLADVIAKGALDLETAARHVAVVARAIDRLHKLGVVHRDLKPSNILLDDDGRPHVTDFGLAKMLADGPVTHTGAIVGTPSYMAPEQASSRATEVGPLSDVYALGAILYELLTGRPPFLESSPLDTLVQVLEGEPDRPSKLNSKVPRPLEQICLKCLEKDPRERYSSAAALADDLDRFLTGEPVEARRLGPWTRLRRWARREPSLATRLSIFAICASVFQIDQYLLASLDSTQIRYVRLLLLLGVAASLVFRLLLRASDWSNAVRYAWSAADIILFSSMVWFLDGLKTPLVAGYFLLVAASGLWFRERLVWFNTVLSAVAYGILVVESSTRNRAWDYPHRHVLFMLVLLLSGLIVAYQVKRVRALSLYYEHRPLP